MADIRHRLELNQLSFAYRWNKPALNDLNFQINGPGVIGLLGPNGSGKSTLLKILAGQIKGYDGMVYFDGSPLSEVSKAEIAYLPDRVTFPLEMSVGHLLEFYTVLLQDFDTERAQAYLERFGYSLHDRGEELSKGEQERLQLIMTMCRRCRLYLLDEPLGAVDPVMRELLFETIFTQFPEEALVLVSTHLLREAEAYMDAVIFLRQGELLLQEETEYLRELTGRSIDEYFREVFRCV